MSPHDWLGGQALTFARPWLLLLLLLIPLLAWLRGRFGPRAAIIFSATAPFRAIGKGSANRAGQILRALVWLALAAFIVGIARPQLGKSLTKVEASGIDIMLVLDVSNSMLAKDFTIGGDEATRLDAVREQRGQPRAQVRRGDRPHHGGAVPRVPVRVRDHPPRCREPATGGAHLR